MDIQKNLLLDDQSTIKKKLVIINNININLYHFHEY